MPSSAIIDVAIGIAFVYLFLSLICSIVNETLAAIFALRSKNLVAGINGLFSESMLNSEKSFVQAIYESGLIRGFFQDPPDAKDPATGKPLMTLPSVLETASKRFRVNLPSYIPSRAFSSALVGVLVPSSTGKPVQLEDLRTAILNLEKSPTRDALLNLIASTEKDVDEFQEKLEKWFDDGMDRVAGWYKRRAQKFLIAIGFATALILNVDTIKLAQNLWNNPVEREAFVDLTKKYTSEDKNAVQAAVSESADQKAGNEKLKSDLKLVNEIEGHIPFPFGWHERPRLRNLISMPGWIITALALSLGAPFWFDTLNKFMVVRATVKPREKSQTEGSKD